MVGASKMGGLTSFEFESYNEVLNEERKKKKKS